MSNHTRRSFAVPNFSLHGAPYDPPVPTVAPPPVSAPIVGVPQPGPASTGQNGYLAPTDGPSENGWRPSRRSVSAAQAELDEAVAVMQGNIQALAGRGERLETLESRTESLAVAARSFRKSANKVRQDMWWKDMKMRFIIGLAIVAVIGLTVLSIVQAVRSRNKGQSHIPADNTSGKREEVDTSLLSY